jgi:hypothetical protein
MAQMSLTFNGAFWPTSFPLFHGALGRRQVLQAHPSEIAQRDLAGQTIGDAIDYRLRDQELATVRRTHDARRSVHRRTEKVVVALLDFAQVQTASDATRNTFRCGRIGKRLLQIHGRFNGIERVRKRGIHAIAENFHEDPAVLLYGRTGERVVLFQRARDSIGLRLPEAGTAFDVGEKDRRGHVQVSSFDRAPMNLTIISAMRVFAAFRRHSIDVDFDAASGRDRARVWANP